MTTAEYKTRKKQSKYRNRIVRAHGRTFHSKWEAEYAGRLIAAEKAGEIQSLEFQVSFSLYVQDVKVTTYIADMVYWDPQQYRKHIVDCKGFLTPEYKIKRALMKAIYGITIEEVYAKPKRRRAVI